MPASRTSTSKELVKPSLRVSNIVSKKSKKRSYSHAHAQILNPNYFLMNLRMLRETFGIAC